MATNPGWNKAARLLEQRRRQIRERRPPTLEPPFPWRADPFPAEFFGIRDLGSGGTIDTAARP